MTTTTSTRKNSYAGSCGACGATVAAGAGSLANVAGRWTVSHLTPADCMTACDKTGRRYSYRSAAAFNAPRSCKGCGQRINRRGECDECGYMG